MLTPMPTDPSVGSIFECANDIFGHQARDMIVGAMDRATRHLVPSRYVIAVTDIIGQDCANDVSEVLLVHEQSNGKALIRSLLGPTWIFRDHAVRIAAAYAIREGVETVMWFKDQTYAWV